MAYDKKKIFEQAKAAIMDNKLFFIDDVVAFLPIARSTFYDWEMDKSDELKGLLNENKIKIKSSMRSKWYKSQNATLQMALMKLICTDDERKKLAVSYVESKNENKNVDIPVSNWVKGTSQGSDDMDNFEPNDDE